MKIFFVLLAVALTASPVTASELYHSLGKTKGISAVIQADDFSFIIMQESNLKRNVINRVLSKRCADAGSKIIVAPIAGEVDIPWQGNSVPVRMKAKFECGAAFQGAFFDIVKPGVTVSGAVLRTVQRNPVDPKSQVIVKGVPWERD